MVDVVAAFDRALGEVMREAVGWTLRRVDEMERRRPRDPLRERLL
jgi:hypothetical protein